MLSRLAAQHCRRVARFVVARTLALALVAAVAGGVDSPWTTTEWAPIATIVATESASAGGVATVARRHDDRAIVREPEPAQHATASGSARATTTRAGWRPRAATRPAPAPCRDSTVRVTIVQPGGHIATRLLVVHPS